MTRVRIDLFLSLDGYTRPSRAPTTRWVRTGGA